MSASVNRLDQLATSDVLNLMHCAGQRRMNSLLGPETTWRGENRSVVLWADRLVHDLGFYRDFA